ncbi:hypothetical protein [Oceanicella sp. SM1341]|nr:hypothetical protein [Oceanicella sp. SM1341]
MKAFILAVVAIVGIGVAAPYALNSMGWSSAEVYKMPNVRLDQDPR